MPGRRHYSGCKDAQVCQCASAKDRGHSDLFYMTSPGKLGRNRRQGADLSSWPISRPQTAQPRFAAMHAAATTISTAPGGTRIVFEHHGQTLPRSPRTPAYSGTGEKRSQYALARGERTFARGRALPDLWQKCGAIILWTKRIWEYYGPTILSFNPS